MPQVTPPWDAEQLASLNDFQHAGYFHPFTCPRTHSEPGKQILRAGTDGWVCPGTLSGGSVACDYRQYWAHGFMADGSWREPAAAIGDAFAYDEPSPQELARWEAERRELAARIAADPALRARLQLVITELDDPDAVSGSE